MNLLSETNLLRGNHVLTYVTEMVYSAKMFGTKRRPSYAAFVKLRKYNDIMNFLFSVM